MKAQWIVWAQDPEGHDDQGVFLKDPSEDEPWVTEVDCEQFDAIHNPSSRGYAICDLADAQRFLDDEGFGGKAIELKWWQA